MPVDTLGTVAATLVAPNPRAQALNVLATLVTLADAAGGAVLATRPDGDGELFAVSGEVPLGELGKAVRASRGKRAADPGHALVPLQAGASTGLLYLHRPRHRLSEADLRVFTVTLGQALAAARAPQREKTAERLLAGSTVEEMERDQLVAALRAQEWNIMRAARALGLSRRTVYVWMRRYGVSRPRPARLGRPPKASLRPA